VNVRDHLRRSNGQQGFTECPLCLQWRPNLCVATSQRDVPIGDIACCKHLSKCSANRTRATLIF
jgi:hypothetical protein